MERSGLRGLNEPRRKRGISPAEALSNVFYGIIGVIMRSVAFVLLNIGTAVISVMELVADALLSLLKPILRFFGVFISSVNHRVGSVFPFSIRESLEKRFIYSGLARNPEEMLGMTFMYSVLFPIAACLLSLFVMNQGLLLSIASGAVGFAFVWIVLYLGLEFLVDKRTANIEKVIPDLLSMIAQNMSAGMTPYNALWVAARPEFGGLAEEIQKVARDTLTGTPLEVALVNMTNRVRSPKLNRTVKLMIQGMRSGGELPAVLQEIARDIRTEQNLVRRMESETTAQVMFILFSLVLGAPLLFASSSLFIEIFSKTFSMIDVSSMQEYATSSSVSLKELSIGVDSFILYAGSTLFICSFLGSLLIGLMRSGKMTRGIPMIPVAIACSIGVFLLLRQVLLMVFGTLLNA